MVAKQDAQQTLEAQSVSQQETSNLAVCLAKTRHSLEVSHEATQ